MDRLPHPPPRRPARWIVTVLAALAGLLPIFAPATRPARAADAGAASDGKADAKADAKVTIPVFILDAPVTESTGGESLPLFSTPGVSLREWVDRINKAKDDPSVKAVVLLCDAAEFGLAQSEELRQAIARLRAAGKDVYAHTDSAMLREYTLLSGATRLSASPTADLWITGLHAEQPYLRGLLDKLGVQPDYLTQGDYKSAAELFTRTGPSPEADRMLNWLLDGIYDAHVGLIATGRNLPPQKVRDLIDNGPYTAETAKAAGLIDAVEHRQDFQKFLRDKYGADVTFDRKYGKKKPPQIDLASPFGLMRFMSELMGGGAKKAKSTKPAVAVVYVDGPIVPGQGGFSPLAGTGPVAASSPIRRALDEAANDDSVKAVVLRVDSPGGSAVASEIILDATRRVKAKKPFAVSMGDTAGSGGYYVSLAADTVFADESTITASIGVVAGKFVTDPMWDKIGITFKGYNRGKSAGLLASDHPFTPEERKKLEEWMGSIYKTFKAHVTEARGGKLKKPLDEIAGGRVYTGRQALDLGLVDRIGTLHDAIDHVAERANLKAGEYEVRTVPEPKNPLEVLMQGLTGESPDEPNGLTAVGAQKRVVSLPTLRGPSLWELAAPHLEHLDPKRIAAVKSALLRLQLLQREGAILGTPEMVID